VLLLLLYHWKDFKTFRQSEKFDLVFNWTVVGELMSMTASLLSQRNNGKFEHGQFLNGCGYV